MLLQIGITFFVIAVLYEVYKSYRKRELALISLLFWLVIWLGVAFVVWLPDFTFNIAKLLNVHRGIDAVVYISIVILFYLLFRVLLKIERVERKIEKLIRKESLRGK